jgi:hypothetical protein
VKEVKDKKTNVIQQTIKIYKYTNFNKKKVRSKKNSKRFVSKDNKREWKNYLFFHAHLRNENGDN